MPIADAEVIAAVVAQRPAIAGTAEFVHAHPELAHEEHLCAAHLAGRLGQGGLAVEQGVAGLDTAFRAVLTGGQGGGKQLMAAAGVWDGYDAVLYAHPEFIDTVWQASLWMRRDTLTVAGTRSLRDDTAQPPLEAIGTLVAPAALIGVGRAEGWAFHTDQGAAQFASPAGLDVATDMATVLALAAMRLSEPPP